MDKPYCDVIGCMEFASWERDSAADSDLHDFLCSAHYELLQGFSTAAAKGYWNISIAAPDFSGPTRGIPRNKIGRIRASKRESENAKVPENANHSGHFCFLANGRSLGHKPF